MLACAVAARAVVGRCTSARQLHRQPLRGGRRLGRPALRPVRRSTSPRSRRTRIGKSVSAARLAPQLVLARGRPAVTAPAARLADLEPSRRRRPADAASRRGLRGHTRAVAVELDDRTFAGRIGWREIVVRASNGATVTRSSVPAASVSSELRHYPSNRLRAPLAVTRAVAVVEPGSERGTPPPLGAAAATAHRRRLRGARVARADARLRPALARRSRSSGARPTRSSRATARRSWPATSSARRGGRATRSRSARS